MINANELRIGNKLLTNLKNIHTVSQIQFEHNNMVNEECWIIGDNNHEISCLDLHPIPLTPDILEKCGFVRVSVGYNLKNSVFSLYQSNNPNRQNILPCWNEQICSDVPVKYLHQLQNLIFTLTGSELTLTL